MKTWALAVLLLSPAFAAAEHKQVPLQTGKVISQDLNSYNSGTAVMPLGGGLVGVPITRRSNIVVVETAKARLTWSEAGKNAVILPVNGTIQFYEDGNWFIVVDSKHKKHKFALVHFENIVQEK